MKIKVFELREDERPAYERVCAGLPADVSVQADPEPLTQANLDDLDGFDAVVIVNRSPLDAGMLEQLAARGVRYVATRSIGYNHIDIEAAKRLGHPRVQHELPSLRRRRVRRDAHAHRPA